MRECVQLYFEKVENIERTLGRKNSLLKLFLQKIFAFLNRGCIEIMKGESTFSSFVKQKEKREFYHSFQFDTSFVEKLKNIIFKDFYDFWTTK